MMNPLTGVRVLDLSRALAGPLCTSLLADLGADVIKIERLPAGDVARDWPPFDSTESLYFASINRNKRSVAIDLRAAGVQPLLNRILDSCDVLVENFRPGVIDRFGLDLAGRKQRDGLIVASISGFGPIGPMRDQPGLDQIVQGMSGLMSVTGSAGSPTRVGIPIVDALTGVVAAFGVAAAVAGRHASGDGTHVQTSLLESALSVMTFQSQRFLSLGQVAEAAGNRHPTISPYGMFGTADLPINIAVGSTDQWLALCSVLGLTELATDARFANTADRLEHREDLYRLLNDRLATRVAAEWIASIRAAGVPCGPVYQMDQVFADPQVKALEMVHNLNAVSKTDIPLMRGPLWNDGQPSSVRRPPPELGEHTIEVLRELGLSQFDIEQLLATHTIALPHPSNHNPAAQPTCAPSEMRP